MSFYATAYHLVVLDDEVAVVIIPAHGIVEMVDKLFRTIGLYFYPLGGAEGVNYIADGVRPVFIIELIR